MGQADERPCQKVPVNSSLVTISFFSAAESAGWLDVGPG